MRSAHCFSLNEGREEEREREERERRESRDVDVESSHCD
jgi:hypothetical protein